MVGKDNVLITITTAANMGGIEQAKAGLLSLNVATLGLTVAVAGAVMAGKSMIDIAERQQKSHANLAQAVKVAGGNIAETNAYLDKFITSNRNYLSSQSEVEDSYGALLRSGIPAAEAQKDLGRATDLAALKGISLTDATNLLVAAEHGRTRGLIDLGITTQKFTDAEGNVINQGKNMALVMAEIDAKTQGGRNTLTETQQISNRLSMDWQDLATKGGPKLLGVMDEVLKKASDIYDWFDRTGKNDHLWAGISKRLTDIAGWIEKYVLSPLRRAHALLASLGVNLQSTPVEFMTQDVNFNTPTGLASGSAAFGKGGRATGGPVLPGGSYTVGESGPETLLMGSSGGFVVPHGQSGGGKQVYVILQGIYAGDGPSLDILANKIALRLGYATGR